MMRAPAMAPLSTELPPDVPEGMTLRQYRRELDARRTCARRWLTIELLISTAIILIVVAIALGGAA